MISDFETGQGIRPDAESGQSIHVDIFSFRLQAAKRFGLWEMPPLLGTLSIRVSRVEIDRRIVQAESCTTFGGIASLPRITCPQADSETVQMTIRCRVMLVDALMAHKIYYVNITH